MKIRWNRIHIFILIFIIFICAAAYWFSYAQFISSVKAEVIEVTEQLEIQEQISADITSDEKADVKANHSTNLQKKLPIEKNLDQFLLLLTEIESNTDVRIQQIRTENSNNNTRVMQQVTNYSDTIKSLPIELQLTSVSHANLDAFLHELSNLERIVNLDVIQIGIVSGNQIQATVSLTAFYNPTLTALQIESPTFEYDQQEEDQE